MVHFAADLARHVTAFDVPGLGEPVLEVFRKELETAQGIAKFMRHLGSHPPERRQSSASQALQLTGGLEGHRGLRGEEREHIEIVGRRFHPGLDNERAGGAAADEERGA